MSLFLLAVRHLPPEARSVSAVNLLFDDDLNMTYYPEQNGLSLNWNVYGIRRAPLDLEFPRTGDGEG